MAFGSKPGKRSPSEILRFMGPGLGSRQLFILFWGSQPRIQALKTRRMSLDKRRTLRRRHPMSTLLPVSIQRSSQSWSGAQDTSSREEGTSQHSPLDSAGHTTGRRESERASGGWIQTEFQHRVVRAQRRHSALISAASLRGCADLGALCLRHIETPWTTEKPILILPYQTPKVGEAWVMFAGCQTGVFKRVQVKGRIDSFLDLLPGHIKVHHPRACVQCWTLESVKTFTKYPSARFSWIYLFQENWKPSRQMKSLLSVCMPEEWRHLRQNLRPYLKGDPTQGAGQCLPTQRTASQTWRDLDRMPLFYWNQ